MQKKDNRHILDVLSSKLEKVISSNSTNKEDELHSIAIELREKAIEDCNKQKKQRSYSFLVFVVFAFSLIGNILLNDRNSALNDRNSALNDRIIALERRDSLLMQIMDLDSTSTITYRVRNGNPITYHQLANERDSIERVKEHYKIGFELITKNYPITLSHNGNVYMIHAPQIDSAFLLLPLYRDMIEYDKKSNSWITTRIKHSSDK